jgi:hypothetical protein
LDKVEQVTRNPFWGILLTFWEALQHATDIIIAGYGLGDYHINKAIKEAREHKQNLRTYIVDLINPPTVGDFISKISPDGWHTIFLNDPTCNETIPGFDGWIKIPGADSTVKSGPVYLWLLGFDSFCKSVIDNGLPGH